MLYSKRSRYLTIVLGVLSIIVGTLLSPSQTTYAASTTTYTRINNQTIKAVDCQTKAGCSTPYYYYMGLYQWNYSRVPGHHNNNIIDTVGESSLSNLGIEEGVVFNGTIPSDKVFVRIGTDACMDFITYTSTSNLSQDGWQHIYMPKINGQCAVFSSSNNVKPIGNIDPNFRSLTTLYQDTPSTIKSTNSSKTTEWLKVTKDVDGTKASDINWWIQDPSSAGQYCPSVIAKSGSDFIYMRAETLNGNYPNPASQDVFYAETVKSLGKNYQTNLSQCRLWTDTSDGSDSPWFGQSRIQIADLINGTEQTIKNLTWDKNVARTYDMPGKGHGVAAAIVGAGLFDDLVGPADAGEFTKFAIANNLKVDTDSTRDSTTPQGISSTCKVEGGLGWIICPAMTFIGKATDVMYGFIESQLSINPNLFKDTEGTYTAWKIFRDYANIAFVIAFIIIMYSQITSVGITNYGIKKMLPKLIIAAILVNVSFYVCMLAVDLFNLLGWSVSRVLTGISDTVLINAGGHGLPEAYNSIGGLIMGVLAVGAILVIALAAGLLAPALIAVTLVFGILLLRQALVVILVVISPIAIVAYLLPNTEKLFRQWMSVFIKVLAVFPVVALVVGGSKLASSVISVANLPDISQGGVDVGGLNATNATQGLIALGVMTIPFFVVPSLLKKSLEAAGSIGAKVSGLADKGVRKSMNSQSRLAKKNDRAVQKRLGRANRLTGQVTASTGLGRAWQRGRNRLTRATALGGAGLRATPGMRSSADAITREAQSLADADFKKQVDASQINYDSKGADADFALNSIFETDASGKRTGKLKAGVSEAQRAATIERVMSTGSFGQRKELVEASDDMSDRERKRISDGVFAKGDQNIYGSSIGSKIMTHKVGGADGLRATTLENIASGSFNAEHLVQGEGSATYAIDVARGEDSNIIDPKTGAPTKVAPPTDPEKLKEFMDNQPYAINNLLKAKSSTLSSPATKVKAEGPKMKGQLDRL